MLAPRSLLLIAALLALIAGCRPAPRGAATAPAPVCDALSLTTSDGLRISACLYRVSTPQPPGLVLVPMRGSDRHAWDAFARYAQQEGIMCVALDLRGHGESRFQSGGTISHRGFSTQDWLAAANDLAAGKQALLEAGADPDNIAIAGASIGANLALHYAQNDPEIQALVLLSPGMDYHGLTVQSPLRRYGNRPILLLTSIGDAYSAQSCAQIKAEAVGHCEIREYEGAAHGTDLFDSAPLSIEQIVLWLQPIIGPKRPDAENL